MSKFIIVKTHENKVVALPISSIMAVNETDNVHLLTGEKLVRIDTAIRPIFTYETVEEIVGKINEVAE